MVLSNCDIGANICSSMNQFPQFDFNFIKKYQIPELWSVDELRNENHKNKIWEIINSKCKTAEEKAQQGPLIMLEYMKN